MGVTRFLCLGFMSLSLQACLQSTTGVSSGPLCIADSPQQEADQVCSASQMSFFVQDSFERDHVFGNDIGGFNFSWRTIINDVGSVIDSTLSNNVEAKIFDDMTLGVASLGSRALYFRGREGRSIHNIYLISETYDLSSFHAGAIQFDYLPVDLEAGEYIRLEVCNSTLVDCGVGESLNRNKLNSDAWLTLFEGGGDSGSGLDGFNQNLSDWQRARVDFYLENYPSSNFTFRFNVRMDEGFIGNEISNGMEDGLGLDNVLGATSAEGVYILF